MNISVCPARTVVESSTGLPSSLASVTLLIQPVTTAFLGVVILGQSLVPRQIFGAALVLLGLFFAIRSRVRRQRST
jgi:drug/metabolite transporter (DMT)-like permease